MLIVSHFNGNVQWCIDSRLQILDSRKKGRFCSTKFSYEQDEYRKWKCPCGAQKRPF